LRNHPVSPKGFEQIVIAAHLKFIPTKFDKSSGLRQKVLKRLLSRLIYNIIPTNF